MQLVDEVTEAGETKGEEKSGCSVERFGKRTVRGLSVRGEEAVRKVGRPSGVATVYKVP
jgi:hypothetical protein